jgi:DNA primase
MSINVIDLAVQDTSLHKVSHREVAGPCPRCHGSDRFHVQPGRKDNGAWMCRHCWPAEEQHGWGDDIDYLRQMRGMSYHQAQQFLETGGESVPASPLRDLGNDTGNSGYWTPKRRQERLSQVAREAEQNIWQEEWADVLDYLLGRGLTEEILRGAHLGAYYWRGVRWLTIPWFDPSSGRYWRVTVRDIRLDIPPDKRYKAIDGSLVREALYGIESLAFGRPVILVEGEIDALSVIQQAGDLVSVVATGSTSGGHDATWLMKLINAPHVFVAFDSEEKGEKAARYWLDNLPNASRWRAPMGKDANDMLRQDANIRLWVQAALATLESDISQFETCAIELPVERDEERNSEPVFQNAIEQPVAPVEEVSEVRIFRTPKEEFTARIHTLVSEVFGAAGCTVRIEPKGSYTLAAHVAEINEANRQAYLELERQKYARDRAQRAKPKSMEWTRAEVAAAKERRLRHAKITGGHELEELLDADK